MAVVREVEVKYSVRDAEALLPALERVGVTLGRPVFHDDQAYAPIGWRYGDAKLGVSFVRLRTVEGQHTFTLKRPAENALSCDEFETTIVDRKQMHLAIAAMGFYPTTRIAKTRRTASFGNMAVCVDEVDGLGTFLELERIVPDDACGEDVQAELAQFAVSLAVEADRTTQTYDSLVHASLASWPPGSGASTR